jgi:alpha-L-rhamnosidase
MSLNAFAHSRFVWISDSAPHRNQFVLFENVFVLLHVPERLVVHVFADSRYRMLVNGVSAWSGPARFVTSHPEYDTIDITSLLRQGHNRIQVLVNYYGAPSFQTMPDGQPGFIAAGDNTAIDLNTPGSWTATRMTAWDAQAPVFSFAQPPVEICDTRQLEQGAPAPVVPLSKAQSPWGTLRPFSGIPHSFAMIGPRQLDLVAPLDNRHQRYGFMLHDPSKEDPTLPNSANLTAEFSTWLWSPATQTISIDCFWCDAWLRGQPIETTIASAIGNRGEAHLRLQQGWNQFCGRIELLTAHWPFMIGIPNAARVTLHARPDQTETAAFAVSPLKPRQAFSQDHLNADPPPADWRMVSGDTTTCTPARHMGWDRLAHEAIRHVPPEKFADHACRHTHEATWVFSFSGEFLGHILLEVEAPSGTLLDIACDDWQQASGAVALYGSNPFTDSADRFILAGGCQSIELFHARGGKYIQVTMRTPGQKADLALHALQVRSRRVWNIDETLFDSDHPVLNRAWPVAMRTLMVSIEDAYTDCPWRERGSYIEDSRVAQQLNFLLTPDLRLARRQILTFAHAQRPDGQMPPCAPAWLRLPHEDFTLSWILMLHDHWAFSGDLNLVTECRSELERIWSSPTWTCHASGLWSLANHNAFFDWGILRSEREGAAHAGINILRVAAARATAELLKALDDHSTAASFDQLAQEVTDALYKVLWIEEEGRLRPSLEASTPGLHANALALGHRIGTRQQQQRILAYLEPMLRNNLARGIEQGHHGGHLELVTLFPLLPALAELERPDLAEQLIEDHYGYLQQLGDDTLPECFSRVAAGQGSRCHCWSGAAATYAAAYVLGLRPAVPGRPDQWVFNPRVHGITRARGRIAHPRGWIEVEWHLNQGRIVSHIQAPPGVGILSVPCADPYSRAAQIP